MLRSKTTRDPWASVTRTGCSVVGLVFCELWNFGLCFEDQSIGFRITVHTLPQKSQSRGLGTCGSVPFFRPPRFTPTALTSAYMLRLRGRQIAHETINTQPWPCLKLLVRFYCRHLQQCLDWNGEHGEMHRNGLGCGIAASNFKPVYFLALWVPLFCPQCLVDAPRSLKRLGMKLQWRPEATR